MISNLPIKIPEGFKDPHFVNDVIHNMKQKFFKNLYRILR